MALMRTAYLKLKKKNNISQVHFMLIIRDRFLDVQRNNGDIFTYFFICTLPTRTSVTNTQYYAIDLGAFVTYLWARQVFTLSERHLCGSNICASIFRAQISPWNHNASTTSIRSAYVCCSWLLSAWACFNMLRFVRW